jgi:hypothetical protein
MRAIDKLSEIGISAEDAPAYIAKITEAHVARLLRRQIKGKMTPAQKPMTINQVRSIVRVYNERCGHILPPVRQPLREIVAGSQLARKILRRGLAADWEGIFAYVLQCPFLCGELTAFRATLDWIAGNGYERIINRNYQVRTQGKAVQQDPEAYASGWGREL